MQPEAVLKSFGLTDYETRAYLTLLKLGLATAENISEVGNIPLPRVYDTVTELQRKGFVLISKTRPKKFKPLPVDKALKNFIDIQKNDMQYELKKLEDGVKAAVDSLNSDVEKIEVPEGKWDIWAMEKRSNITKILDDQKKIAKKEILVFSGDMSWVREPTFNSIVKDLIKKGVKIRTVVSDPKGKIEVLKNIQRAKQLGIKIKIGYLGLVRGHVIDDKVAAVNIEISKEGLNVPMYGLPGSDYERKYEMVIFNNPVLISAFKENFEFWWQNLK